MEPDDMQDLDDAGAGDLQPDEIDIDGHELFCGSPGSHDADGHGSSADGVADHEPQLSCKLGQGVLEAIGAHVAEHRRHVMLLQEQCQRARA